MLEGIENVQNIFREVFEDPELKIFPEMTASDVKQWDSFNHINLIIVLEEYYNLSFTTEEIAEMANVGDLIKVLGRKGIVIAW